MGHPYTMTREISIRNRGFRLPSTNWH